MKKGLAILSIIMAVIISGLFFVMGAIFFKSFMVLTLLVFLVGIVCFICLSMDSIKYLSRYKDASGSEYEK